MGSRITVFDENRNRTHGLFYHLETCSDFFSTLWKVEIRTKTVTNMGTVMENLATSLAPGSHDSVTCDMI